MNLANKITIARVFLIPVFLIFISIKGISFGVPIATIVFIIAASTDKLDGYIARSRNQITNFGKFMDPLADKLLVTAALVSLVEYKMLPAWIVIIIIAREFAVTGLRVLAMANGRIIAASKWGKLKTTTQIAAIIIALLNLDHTFISVFSSSEAKIFNNFIGTLAPIAIYATLIATIISGIDYFLKNRDVVKSNE